jgi:hypothetical protein
MPLHEWQILRQKILKEHNHTCVICLSTHQPQCHELWEYNDSQHIQTLTAIIPLCNLCHAVKHIGRTKNESPVLYEKAVAHFMKVNKCTRMTFETHRIQALEQFNERSKFQWRIDIGLFKGVNHVL